MLFQRNKCLFLPLELCEPIFSEPTIEPNVVQEQFDPDPKLMDAFPHWAGLTGVFDELELTAAETFHPPAQGTGEAFLDFVPLHTFLIASADFPAGACVDVADDLDPLVNTVLHVSTPYHDMKEYHLIYECQSYLCVLLIDFASQTIIIGKSARTPIPTQTTSQGRA